MPEELSLFFAAFRLPDMIFEVLVFGTFASAFIPVFTKALQKGNSKAWELASSIMNIALIIFVVFSFLVYLFADNIYGVFAPGFGPQEREEIVRLTRILIISQGFFVISYVLTGVLESSRRFLVPALAPVLYNLGIIFGIVFLSEEYGLLAPAIGVVIGALLHLLIQLPLAVKLGFKFSPKIKITPEVIQIGKLALPRVIEISFLQLVRMAELYLSSIISTASYAYLTFGNTVQLLPVGLFGVSIAKAALPTLSRLADDYKEFRRTLFNSFYQIIFLVLPVATMLVVLRIPIVRLIYGTEIFNWESTVQTGKVVSAFAVGVVFVSSSAILSRGFYALNDTKTPVIVSIFTITLNIILSFIFVMVLSLPVWGLALAFSLASVVNGTALFYLINKKTHGPNPITLLKPVAKSTVAALGSGAIMYIILKIFDRSVWVKKLSFLSNIDIAKPLPFEKFVLDTRYTVNLFILTVAVALVGLFVYIGLSVLFKSSEIRIFFNLAKRIFKRQKFSPLPKKEQEVVAPTPTDSSGV